MGDPIPLLRTQCRELQSGHRQEDLGTIQSTRVPQRLTGYPWVSLRPSCFLLLQVPPCPGWPVGRGPILAPTQLGSWPPPRPQGLLGPKPELKLQTQQSSSSVVPARGGGLGAAGERAGVSAVRLDCHHTRPGLPAPDRDV